MNRAMQRGLAFSVAAALVSGARLLSAGDPPPLRPSEDLSPGTPPSRCGDARSAQSGDSAPFLRLRDARLGYHGPAETFTNLTEYRIGWFGPSEATNSVGNDMWWAANLAVEQANRDGGCQGKPARLVPRWAVDPWGTGVSQLTRMVYEEQPLAILGSVDSASTHLAEQVVAKANLPLVSPVSTDKSVTLAGVSWMFSCAPGDDAIATVLAAEALRTLPSPHAAFALWTTTDHESRMTARELVRELSRRGRAPTVRVDLPPHTAALGNATDALLRGAPKLIFIVAGAEDAARAVLALRARLTAIPILGGPGLSRARFAALAGAAAESVRFPLLASLEPSNPERETFAAAFAAAHRRPPDYTAILSYDATRLLLAAIERAGPNRAGIREALATLSPWTGLGGTIRFDGTGQNRRCGLRLATWRDGRVLPVAFESNLNPPDS